MEGGGRERLVQNQKQFRYANQRLGELVTVANLNGEVVSYVCECADELCFGRIDVTLAEHEEAHVLLDSYTILSGHPRIEHEDIAEERGLYEIVQKG